MNFELTWLTSENNTFVLLLKINTSVPPPLILISKKWLTTMALLEPSCLLNIYNDLLITIAFYILKSALCILYSWPYNIWSEQKL